MDMQPANVAYDRTITVFSPDGRLFQVEYAREAVKRGTTAVGVVYDDGVILAVDKRIVSKLIEPASIEKIYQINDWIGCATSGLVADARFLVDRARLEAQIHRIYYNEDLGAEALVKRICDFKQTYTQYGGVRPFGTALLVGGMDKDIPKLFETDPSGALMAYKAGSIGEGRTAVLNFFETHYKMNMDYKTAFALAIEALYISAPEEINAENIEAGVVTKEKGFSKIPKDEILRCYSNIKKKK